jgi:hypothetical protein
MRNFGNRYTIQRLIKAVKNQNGTLTFRDAQLQKRCERVISTARDCPPDQLPIHALLDACNWFRLIEGEESPRSAEAIELLLSPELRPALRDWYRRMGDDLNPFADEFREQLSELAGERL